MTAHEARYDLSRLQDLLRILPQALRAAGVMGPEADLLAAEGQDFGARLLLARQEQAARVTTCATC
jgi:hypothetical protein